MTVTLSLADAAHDLHTRRALSDLSLAVAKRKKIVVVTGAGISCSSGIPDFRSSDGLYNLVKERYPEVVLKGRDLFDASLFRDTTSTSVFFSFIAELKKKIDIAMPSPTHHFIQTLDAKSKLLRSYTQNIDGLEERVGLVGCAPTGDAKGKGNARLRSVRHVQLHGDIHRVRCIACAAESPCTEEHLTAFLDGVAPTCPECTSRSEARVARSARALRVGSLRPAIVLYDEPHPLGDDIGEMQTSDLSKKPDMLIIMGTSLKVHGLKKLVKEFAKAIHVSPLTTSSSTASSSKRPFKVIFVNRTPPASEWGDIIDYHVEGDTDSWTTKVIEDWKKMRPADWEVQQTLLATGASPTGLKLVKPAAATKKVAKKNENIAPKDYPVASAGSPPPSPGKRRQKGSHYDDPQSSPSKRASFHPVGSVHVPASDRKLLFTETTNTAEPMDVSIVDMSMQDVELEVLKDLQKKAVTKAPLPPPKSIKPAGAPKKTAAPRRTAAPRKPAVRSAATTARRKASKVVEAIS